MYVCMYEFLLHIASFFKCRKTEALKLLIENGADIYTINKVTIY